MKLYDVIYADPPWRYNFSKSKSRKIENQYKTMTLEDIKNLNVPSADNSVLYLWATAPKLLEALEVMKAWGFQYKTNAIWDKVRIGMGYWFRGRHELLLVGIKGKFSPPDPSLRIASVFSKMRGAHSEKPSYVRHIIGIWFKNERKLEMFAREKTDGWDVHGDDVAEWCQEKLKETEK